MAKNPPKPGGPSRLRIIMVDAVIDGEHDLNSVVNALSNAFKPVQPTAKSIAAPGPQLNGNSEDHEEPEAFETGEGNDALDVTPTPARQRSPRKIAATPAVLELDLNSQDVPLAAFAAQHKAESHRERYLVASAWFHDHGGVPNVSIAHVYTAYRHLKWPLTNKDFPQTLRDLKAEGFYTSGERGSYIIGHLGLQRVAEMKIGAE